MYYFYKGEEKFIERIFNVKIFPIVIYQWHKLINKSLHNIFATVLRKHNFFNKHSLHSQSFEIES